MPASNSVTMPNAIMDREVLENRNQNMDLFPKFEYKRGRGNLENSTEDLFRRLRVTGKLIYKIVDVHHCLKIAVIHWK